VIFGRRRAAFGIKEYKVKTYKLWGSGRDDGSFKVCHSIHVSFYLFIFIRHIFGFCSRRVLFLTYFLLLVCMLSIIFLILDLLFCWRAI
jgi:hypothetical protein